MRVNHVSLLLGKRGSTKIISYLSKNRDLISNPKEKFHSTIRYSVQNPVFLRRKIIQYLDKSLPFQISPDTYGFDVFREKFLVLKYSHHKIEEIYNQIIGEGVRQILLEYPELNPLERGIAKEYLDQDPSEFYANFNPHITLSKNFNGDVNSLPGFTQPLTFSSFIWKI